ncbi:MAG: hypothetical protein JWR61_1916 [Ferruginibacter sp.]|nr:hypothetical protein [Ferruginibacter sp.]
MIFLIVAQCGCDNRHTVLVYNLTALTTCTFVGAFSIMKNLFAIINTIDIISAIVANLIPLA